MTENNRLDTRGKDVCFKTEVDSCFADEHYSQLETLFREHFRMVHAAEDAKR
jgi:hypothetical protein